MFFSDKSSLSGAKIRSCLSFWASSSDLWNVT